MSEPRVAALMEQRAAALTKCTGTTFTIEKGELHQRVRHYILKAQRGGIAYLFQHKNIGLPRDQMEAFLTTMLDLCKIGLLPVDATDAVADERARIVEYLKGSYETAATDPGIPVNAADMINTIRICIERNEI